LISSSSGWVLDVFLLSTVTLPSNRLQTAIEALPGSPVLPSHRHSVFYAANGITSQKSSYLRLLGEITS